MAFVTIEGNVIRIALTGARERTPVLVGNTSRSYAGTLRSTVRAVKREWELTTSLIDGSELTFYRGFMGSNQRVICNGTFFQSTAVVCIVTFDTVERVFVSGGRERWVLKLLVAEA